tara:strand:- start:106 stop:312 length:207 start_codon:yes stop_codon:yes gene_type:complete
MFTIKQPQTMIFGKFCASKYTYKKKPLLITSKGAKSRSWLEYLNLDESYIFDEEIQKILSELKRLGYM